MGKMPWMAYLWPGLPQIWVMGSWPALGVAVGFAMMVNLALATTVLWNELFTPGLRSGIWMAVAVIWAVSAIISFRWAKRQADLHNPVENEDTFGQAVDHYLKGNWFEAEQTLMGLLRRNARDLDAGLMLATLLRHTQRMDEAKVHLDRLERFDGCEKWELEIRRERELLHQALAHSDETPVADSDEPDDGRSDNPSETTWDAA